MIKIAWAVVVAQLVERSFPTQDILFSLVNLPNLTNNFSLVSYLLILLY